MMRQFARQALVVMLEPGRFGRNLRRTSSEPLKNYAVYTCWGSCGVRETIAPAADGIVLSG